MRVTNRPDLEIAGIGNAAGGEYYKVKMEGVCKIDGPIDCFEFEASGMTTVGSLRAEQRLKVNGKLTSHGALQAGNAELEGQITVNGPLRADHMSMNGFVRVKGHCELKQSKARGALIVDGWLTGEQIEMKLEGPLQAEGIKAQRLVVQHSGKGNLRKLIESLLPHNWQAQAQARTIEADIVELEETVAQVVRGRTVIIGRGCDIDRVEYVSELIVHPQAQVRSRQQIEG
ncbi:hypothetical protein [Paenibacillus sacheonensis]|uniref:Polymer-forming cytoskeletal protein n=1 Tax=Paenibacillus sacheonensis TaxID=742054 RepID=A0A7X4YR06_9BACL|nr:hypothetical protein [Paenibacillus sacheonensis]MBM7565250.1 cytoskeletal protein CcmA (bactofilin family) [Paenibacillus sacheonensis]NBC69974.1 hypothetical protein [Paenibacillus sacheonensis]